MVKRQVKKKFIMILKNVTIIPIKVLITKTYRMVIVFIALGRNGLV